MPKWQITKVMLLFLVISSCTHIPKDSEEHVLQTIHEKIGTCVHWNQTCCENSLITNYIQDLLFQPLSVESAMQIALLNNPEVQATFEEIGIAEADLIEAGLLTNPAFEIEVRYPHQKKLRTNIEYLITLTFLDIFLIPLRTRLASTELEQAKLRVANEILNLAFEVRKTFYELIAEQQMLKYTQSIAELTSIEKEIASRQFKVGNIYQLNLEEIQALSLETSTQISKSLIEVNRLREKLNRLLGLSIDTYLLLSDKLPEQTDYYGFDLDELELIALQERLDLQVARQEIVRFCHLLGLRDWWTYTQLSVGLAGERESDGSNLIGPGLSGNIPIFNFGQAARMRIYAQLRQAQDRLAALEIRVRSEVREAHKLLMNDLNMIYQYREGIIPTQQNILHSSEALYNVMGLGIDRLLRNKRREIESYRNYVVSLRDYWIARIHLDRALGGYLYRLLDREMGDRGL